MNLGYDNDRRFFTALVLLSLGCFVLESILRAYELPQMPLRFGLKVFGTFIGGGVFAFLLVRYKADRYSFAFIGIGLLMFVLTRAFDVASIHRFAADLMGISERSFSRVVDNSVQKAGVYCILLSLISLIITSAKRRAEAVAEVKEREGSGERIRSREAGFRAMFEQSPSPVCHVSLEGRHVLVNRSLCELVGYESEELVGMSLEALVEPDDRELSGRAFEQVLFGAHAMQQCQVRYRHKNGFPIWVQNSISYVHEVEGAPAYLIVVSEDVTERRQRMSQLTESVSLLEATLESTNDGILAVGPGGRITRYNQRFLELWRIPESVLHAMSDQKTIEFVLEQLEDPEGFIERVQELYRDVDRESCDIIRLKDGRIIERFSKPQYVEGRPVGRVWSFRDVTEGRRAQAEQQRLEAQIREAQKLEVLDTLTGGIAHDFNNILSSIVTNTEVAEALSKDSKEVQECLEDIAESCERLSDLIDRVVRFTRREEKAPERLSLEALLREAEKLIRPALPSSIEIKIEIQPGLPMVIGDPTQFHQIFLNLCSNAAAALQGKPGNVTIKLGTVTFEEDQAPEEGGLKAGTFLLIQVSDDGCGMDAETLKRSVEPFFTTKRPGEGSGLGLAVVQGIVKGLQGKMRFDSSPGEGTLVELYFPAAPPIEETIAADLEVQRSSDAGEGQRILFLDDEVPLAKSMAKRMRQLNYAIDVHTDSAAAFQAFKSHPDDYDLVVTDLTMPGMDGIEIAKKVKAISPGIPVILLSGYGSPQIHQRASAVGVAVILKKPVESGSLSWAIREALSSAGASTVSTKIVN